MSNIKIRYSLKTDLTINNSYYDLDTAIHLLNEIQKQGNLRIAANSCGYSYRKAWNLLKHLENLLDSELVNMRRGRGTHTAELGLKLIELDQTNKQFFNDALTTAANKATTALQAVLSGRPLLKIIASDSEKLQQLRQQHLPIELHFDGSGQALTAYAEGQCDIAGFHIAAENNPQQLATYEQYLDQKNDRFILLEQRQQGLMSHPEHPVDSFQQVIDQQLIFVNRQYASGTRLLLDRLLKQQKLNPQQLNGYHHEEHTHMAVACMIASRQADAALGIQSVAKRLKLYFFPITNEYYFLVFKSSNEANEQLQQLLENLYKHPPWQTMNYHDFLKTIAKTAI